MSELNEEKIVDFGAYCGLCEHEKVAQDDEPCNECLHETTNLWSRKPVKFTPKEGKKR